MYYNVVLENCHKIPGKNSTKLERYLHSQDICKNWVVNVQERWGRIKNTCYIHLKICASHFAKAFFFFFFWTQSEFGADKRLALYTFHNGTIGFPCIYSSHFDTLIASLRDLHNIPKYSHGLPR